MENVSIEFMDLVKVDSDISLTGDSLADPIGELFERQDAIQHGGRGLTLFADPQPMAAADQGGDLSKAASHGKIRFERRVDGDGAMWLDGYNDRGELVYSQVENE